MKTNVRLAARVTLPAEDLLKEAGWVQEKTATPDPKDRSEKALVEDGKKASDEPADVRVVADQREPVTSSSKESDRTIRREEIIESDGSDKEDEETVEPARQDLFQDTSESTMLSAFKLAELEQELGMDSDWEEADKYARVASLETQGIEALQTKIETLKSVRTAGLSKPKQKVASALPRFSASRVQKEAVESDSSSNGVVQDSALFA